MIKDHRKRGTGRVMGRTRDGMSFRDVYQMLSDVSLCDVDNWGGGARWGVLC